MGASICGISDSGDAAKEAAQSRSPKKKSANNDDIKYDELLPLPGTSLIDNTFDLQKDLQILQAKYKKTYQPLLERKMIEIQTDKVNKTDIKANSITLMQFNMLADGLSNGYTREENAKTFMNVDKECLRWTYRGVRVVEEILRFDPDVIAMEECDHIEFIMKYLDGYDYVFQEKKTSGICREGGVYEALVKERNGESFEMNNDGCALIYRKSLFEIADKGDVVYVDSIKNKNKLNAIAVPLTVKNGINREIMFVVTHLKSTKSQEGEDLRVKQINSLFTEYVENMKKLPIILCCDLNASPVASKKGYEPLCYQTITDKMAFESVYKLVNGTEPEYTTCKARKDGVNKSVLDYIFIKDGQWEITQILGIPDMDSANKLIPNWFYPSDHFSIAAQLTWT